jgi:hypothetical protein
VLDLRLPEPPLASLALPIGLGITDLVAERYYLIHVAGYLVA